MLKLKSCLAVQSDEEAERALKDAEKAMGRKPIVVLEIPRGVDNPDVMKSASTFAKVVGFDRNVAKVIVMASSAAAAMAFDADGRERRFFLPLLTSEELKKDEATMRTLVSPAALFLLG
eukprot:3345688-Amphidinium_carterae.2